MHSQIYLFFEGRTEEALAFYKKTLGAEIEMMMRFKDAPGPQDPNCEPPKSPNAVMHSTFKLANQQIMASDGMCSGKTNFGGFGLSLSLKTEAEVEKMFAALAEDGKVQQPLMKTFFSPKFGVVADKFGVTWMVLVEQAPPG